MPHVIIYGDSLVTQAEPYLQIVSARPRPRGRGARAIGGTAPCDFVPRIQEDLAARRVDLAVWAFSGNSVGSCMLGADGKPVGGASAVQRYHDDTEQAIEAAEAANVPFVLASPPAPHLPGDVWRAARLGLSLARRFASPHPVRGRGRGDLARR